jgi:hypothetical protein
VVSDDEVPPWQIRIRNTRTKELGMQALLLRRRRARLLAPYV